ncbi:hypothetical protein ANAPC5_01471 [Anaplasma phagocytophilum]|nr:hypothetical protein ANAPC5_01471 [Anaplasma phagocytophilum]
MHCSVVVGDARCGGPRVGDCLPLSWAPSIGRIIWRVLRRCRLTVCLARTAHSGCVPGMVLGCRPGRVFAGLAAVGSSASGMRTPRGGLMLHDAPCCSLMGSGASPWVLRSRPMAATAAGGGARPALRGSPQGYVWHGRDHGRPGCMAAGSQSQEESKLNKMQALLLNSHHSLARS